MAYLNKYGVAIIAVLAVAVIVLVVLLAGQHQSSQAPSSTPMTAANTPAPTTTSPSSPAAAPSSGNTSAKTGGTQSGSGVTPKYAPTGFTIRLVAPLAGATWTIAQQNLIAWNPEAGVSGQIELLDASTLKLVGIILNQIGPHQTSYMWNTRDLLLTRTNPLKTTVTAGNYVVRIAFDGNNLSPITSLPVTITN